MWQLLELGSNGDAVIDHPAPDGTTAMAMAIGHLNAEIAALLLTSESVEPKDQMRYLANEVLKTESNEDSETVGNFKKALSQLLGHPEMISISPEGRQSKMDSKMVDLSKRFPFINEDAETQRAANKSSLEKMLRDIIKPDNHVKCAFEN